MIATVAQGSPPLGSLNADTFWLSTLAMAGAAFGIFVFFRGFRMLQYKRLILNTPLSKIRSASMGLVEVTGNPTGPSTMAAAITGTPCYYYRARGWQWVDSGKGGSWRQVVDESVSVPFFLDDSTGKVLVNPQGANLDVHRSFYDEFSTSFVTMGSPIPENVRKFVATRGLMAGSKIRLEEHIIQPGFPLFVFGTLGENDTLHSWAAQPHVSGKKVSFGFAFGDSINLKFTRDAAEPDVAAKALAGLLQNTYGANTKTSIYISRSGGGPVDVPNDVLQQLQKAGLSVPFPGLAQSGSMTVSKRLIADGLLRSNTVQVNVASDPATATSVVDRPAGTDAAANPDPAAFDLKTRVAIRKGERGDPFTISSQSQREVVRALGWRAIACIWGGPVFALICLYSLFTIWGWM
jgi:E3 Ubiquitin ligase